MCIRDRSKSDKDNKTDTDNEENKIEEDKTDNKNNKDNNSNAVKKTASLKIKIRMLIQPFYLYRVLPGAKFSEPL